MTREMYEFIFNLRASGFMHHTKEDLQSILHPQESGLEKNNVLSMLNNLPIGIGEGERGNLSRNQKRDMHNFLVGCCFFTSSMLVETGKDAEYAYSVSDYYMNKLDDCYSLGDYRKLFIEMMDTFREISDNEQEQALEKIENIHVIRGIHYIRQHLYSNFSASDVAAGIGRDLSYLNTLFKRETGLTLQHFILQEKINEAQKMLTNTDYKIREIAEALGFSSAPHFTKVFNRMTGQSPIEYRSKKR